MAKNEKVPETKTIKPNREQRRHPGRQRPEDEPVAREETLSQSDVAEPGAKRSGHKKKTADKWNQ